MIDRDLLRSIQLVIFDFDGVFTDNHVYVDQNGIESVRCWRSDGLGLARLRDIGVRALIVSTESNTVVTMRANKLHLPCRQGVRDKAAAVMDACAELQIETEHTIFVGNDINDIPAFHAVGIGVAVADCYPEVLEHVAYRTEKPGGFGAVREVCDLIYLAQRSEGAIGQ